MPVDLLIVGIPFVVIVAAIIAVVSKRSRRRAAVVSISGALVFVAIYFLPGWVLMARASGGSVDAQYQLGEYYWTRCGYMWSDIELRDKWWMKAAEGGHPHAMYQVGYFSEYGTSKHIPKSYKKAKEWMSLAAAKGDADAIEWLKDKK